MNELFVPHMAESTELVLPTYPPYMHQGRKFARKDRFKSKDEIAKAYYTELEKIETVVQHILARFLPQCDERILAYWGPKNDGIHRVYRELDFVSGTKEYPELFIEIKSRERWPVKSLKAHRQLRRSLHIAQARWPHLRGFCLAVSMAAILGLDIDSHKTYDIDTLPNVLMRLTEKRTTAWLKGTDVVAYGITQGLLAENYITELPRLRSEMLNPRQLWGHKL